MTDSPVLHLHNCLRQAKEKWAIFLGAGASCDYGIPTMAEIANILRKMIKDAEPGQPFRLLSGDGLFWNVDEPVSSGVHNQYRSLR